MKPYYEHAGITIYHGDCREAVDLGATVLVSDPPYSEDRKWFPGVPVQETARLLSEWVTAFHSTAVFGYPETLAEWCVLSGKVPKEWIVWWCYNKFNARNSGLNRESEHIAIFGDTPGADRLQRERSSEGAKWQCKAGARSAKHRMAKHGDIWKIASPGIGFNHHLRRHPNEKPLDVLTRLVILCTHTSGETILDPFCGSGTTLVAARRAGHSAIGIEIEEKYCEIAAKRLSQEVFQF